MRIRPAARGILAVLLGMALMLVVAQALRLETGQAAQQPVRADGHSDFIAADIESGEPCPSAVKTSLDEVSRLVSTPAWLPNSDVIPPLAGIWMCSGTPTFDYAGITFAYEPGWQVEDAAKRWEAMAQQWGRGSVETVLDRPAFVLPASELDPRGEVLVLVGSTLIRVLGDGKTSIDDLKAAVNTIRLG